MKSLSRIFVILLLSFLVSCSNQTQEEKITSRDFLNPPKSSAVHTWWHWLDGAITKEGITKDLEAMHNQGITRATILNIGLFNGKDFGVPRVIFDTPQWYEMFEWALTKADSLGITIGAHNCDGWSTSGGPWITPEKSMKQFVWTKSYVTGGKKISLDLPQPQAVRDFYRDVAVIAWKSGSGANSFRLARPVITSGDSADAGVLADGSPVSSVSLRKGDYILFHFSQPFTTSRLALHPRNVFMWEDMSKVTTRFDLSVSGDGRHWRKVRDCVATGLNKNFLFDFPETAGKYFRLRVDDNSSSQKVNLGEAELLKAGGSPSYNPDIPYHQEKTVSVKSLAVSNFDSMENAMPGQHFIQKEDIVNITANMDDGGHLQWDAPGGNWTIARFGFTTTGAQNGPATAEGRGLECDKMDTASLNLHWKNYPQKLIAHAGKYAGNTFRFFLIDSWECGYQNWTDSLPSAFRKLRGYDMTDFIPVLCGETITDPGTTEGFLYDFRKTISDMIGQNYYRHFGELCRENNMEYDAEVIYGEVNYPPLDIMKSNSYVDLPMFEFWSNFDNRTLLDYQPSARPEQGFPAASAVIYNKPVVGTEAYTGMAHYSETPQALKPFGDRAFCMGLNQIILHSYVHQPLDKPAGMTLGPYASHFNRENPWFRFASGWMEYQARIQYILQQGEVQHDVLYYIGDQLPQSMESSLISGLPFGYSGQACNEDALFNRITVKDGKLVLNGSLEYSMLILPANGLMELNTLKRIGELLNEGAIIYGEKPVRMLSLENIRDNKQEFDDIASRLWADNNLSSGTTGKGKLYSGIPVAAALKNAGILPGFSTGQPDSLDLMYIHKKAGDEDIWFVFNQRDTAIYRECVFNTGRTSPEIWSPSGGSVEIPAIFREEGSRIRIPVRFGPRESRFFIFREDPSPGHIERADLDEVQIFPRKADLDRMQVPRAQITNGKIEIFANKEDGYRFINPSKKVISVNFIEQEEREISTISATVRFNPSYNDDIGEENVNILKPLNESEQKGYPVFFRDLGIHRPV